MSSPHPHPQIPENAAPGVSLPGQGPTLSHQPDESQSDRQLLEGAAPIVSQSEHVVTEEAPPTASQSEHINTEEVHVEEDSVAQTNFQPPNNRAKR